MRLSAVFGLAFSAFVAGIAAPGRGEPPRGFSADSAAVRAGTYQLDAAHGKITWTVSHFGMSLYRGQFVDLSGRLSVDPGRPERAALQVSVPLDKVGTFHAGLDAHLRNADFFDVPNHPTATFASTRVERVGERQARVTGDLTLKGVTKPVAFVGTFNAAGVASMADLKGKRVSTGAPGSATEVMAFRLIEGAGLDREKDFRARERLSPAESTNAIKDGKLDAYFFVSGVPTSAVTDLGASPGIQLRLVDHAEFVPQIVERYGPVYFPEVIPAGTYPGQTTDNKQMSVANILAVLDTMPNEQATRILEAAWKARDELVQVHAEARGFTLERQKTSAAGVPWHPAAEAFWKAQGAQLA